MTVRELRAKLFEMDQDKDIMILLSNKISDDELTIVNLSGKDSYPTINVVNEFSEDSSWKDHSNDEDEDYSYDDDERYSRQSQRKFVSDSLDEIRKEVQEVKDEVGYISENDDIDIDYQTSDDLEP